MVRLHCTMYSKWWFVFADYYVWILSCVCIFANELNVLVTIFTSKVFSAVWVLMCLYISLEWLNFLLQYLQKKKFLLVWIISCFYIPSDWLNFIATISTSKVFFINVINCNISSFYLIICLSLFMTFHLCLYSWPDGQNFSSQYLQSNGFSQMWFLSCFFNCLY